jgi:hypothetical protein
MIRGSDLYNDIYHDQVGKLILRFNQLERWTKAKHEMSGQLSHLLSKNGYQLAAGKRNEYRLHGGTGKSYIYKVPLNKRGVLSQHRGEFIRVVCVATNRYVSLFMFKPIKKSVIDQYLLTHKISIVATREGSGMTSAWQEYLCVTYGENLNYKVFEGRYSGLAEAQNYYDEELEEYVLPEFIEGMLVTGIEDDYVVGGELSYSDDQEAVEFQSLGSPNLQQWLKEMRWEGYAKELRETVLNFQ